MQQDNSPRRASTRSSTPSSTPVCDAMRVGGQWNPNWEPMAQLDPEIIQKYLPPAQAAALLKQAPRKGQPPGGAMAPPRPAGGAMAPQR